MSQWTIRFALLLVSSAVLMIPGALGSDASSGPSSLEIQRKAEAKTKARHWSEAAVLWQQAVKANPYRAQSWFNLGSAHYQAHHCREAIPAFARALELG